MKNKIKNFFKILTVTAGCLMFASFSPSLDGRAVVVDKGVFPQGLFAKTVGYLPGDIISVTNIAGDTTIDLLVIGALDPSEGVAIMLSPEAADAMGIDKGANNIVKITKRSGQDERVYGNAVISKSAAEIEDWDDGEYDSIGAEENSDAFEEPEAEAEEAAEETEPAEESFEEEAEEGSEEEFEEPAVDEEEAFEETEEEAFEEEAAEESEAEEEAPAEEAEDEALEEEALPEEEFADEEEAFEEEALADEELPEEEAPAEEKEAPAEEDFEEPEEEAAEEEAFDEEEPDALPEEAEEEALEEAPAEESEEEEAAEEESPAEEDFAEAFEEETPDKLPAEEEPEAEEEAEDEAPAEEAFDEDELDALPEETEAPVEESAEESDSEEYEAIVLVPADSNPPESESDEVEDVVSEDELESIDETITLAPVSSINKSVSSVTPVTPAETKPAKSTGTETSYDKYLVPSLNQLESGKYYIQIAAYGSDENILEVINKYGSNYPITIVPMANGKTKQVLIGPVSMDEYKVVLERFKSYGFKDAFLRKVK